LARELLSVLDASDREDAADDADEFVQELSEVLELRRLAAKTPDQRDRQAPETLASALEQGLSMAELAGGRAPGRLVLTTYHSAKGREFIAVVLPGLVEGLVPFYFADQGITAAKLDSERRQFYVAVTRASDAVVLIPGTHFTAWGRTRRSGWSQFVVDIQRAIDAASR
jgi:DNA helicase-2/ATP-dependent DNA helicase PcrA